MPSQRTTRAPTIAGAVVSADIAEPGQAGGDETPAPATPVRVVVGEPSGCGVCGSDDVQYVLETDVGVDAATLASGQVIRAAFCSIDCLAEKLGFAPPEPTD